jgi:hypothetical protein
MADTRSGRGTTSSPSLDGMRCWYNAEEGERGGGGGAGLRQRSAGKEDTGGFRFLFPSATFIDAASVFHPRLPTVSFLQAPNARPRVFDPAIPLVNSIQSCGMRPDLFYITF